MNFLLNYWWLLSMAYGVAGMAHASLGRKPWGRINKLFQPFKNMFLSKISALKRVFKQKF